MMRILNCLQERTQISISEKEEVWTLHQSDRYLVRAFGQILLVSGLMNMKFLNTASVRCHVVFLSLKKIFTGVNCTKEDLEALTNTYSDVELLDFVEDELWFEIIYK